jgi:hypothetical protein
VLPKILQHQLNTAQVANLVLKKYIEGTGMAGSELFFLEHKYNHEALGDKRRKRHTRHTFYDLSSQDRQTGSQVNAIETQACSNAEKGALFIR